MATTHADRFDRTPAPERRLGAVGSQRVLAHGDLHFRDQFNARDVWVWQHDGRYFMHYDAAGELGWLVALACSDDGITWTKHGPVLELGSTGSQDSASASYGTTYFDGTRWHMFYLATQNVTADELKTPSFPYMTMKAEADTPAGPWRKRPDVVPFLAEEGTWYSHTASPGAIVRHNGEFVMIFSAATTSAGGRILRTLGIARTDDLDASWQVDAEPLLPLTEQIENSSLYFETESQTWFLFTNHIGVDESEPPEPPQNSSEYTDAIWVYWSSDPTRFSPDDKAIVLDATNSGWSPRIVGLPSVTRVGTRLGVYFDGTEENGIGHGKRDIGVAWLELPLTAPVNPSRSDA